MRMLSASSTRSEARGASRRGRWPTHARRCDQGSDMAFPGALNSSTYPSRPDESVVVPARTMDDAQDGSASDGLRLSSSPPAPFGKDRHDRANPVHPPDTRCCRCSRAIAVAWRIGVGSGQRGVIQAASFDAGTLASRHARQAESVGEGAVELGPLGQGRSARPAQFDYAGEDEARDRRW